MNKKVRSNRASVTTSADNPDTRKSESDENVEKTASAGASQREQRQPAESDKKSKESEQKNPEQKQENSRNDTEIVEAEPDTKENSPAEEGPGRQDLPASIKHVDSSTEKEADISDLPEEGEEEESIPELARVTSDDLDVIEIEEPPDPRDTQEMPEMAKPAADLDELPEEPQRPPVPELARIHDDDLDIKEAPEMITKEELPPATLKEKLYSIIFEAETFGGKLFDICLLIAIMVSVLIVMLDSVESVQKVHATLFGVMEWVLTILFTVEYALRLYCSPNRSKYATSFFGVIDLLAVIPTYVGAFYPGVEPAMVIRVMRLLRLFRVFKLGRYLQEAELMMKAMRASGPKIFVFLFTVLSATVIIGAVMYIIEGGENGFTSIPRSIYWAIVTLTTVGYGDIAPHTVLGQIIACTVMILGYGMIAVPTGIVSVEMHKAAQTIRKSLSCSNCGAKGHIDDSTYCRHCGAKLSSVDIVTASYDGPDRRSDKRR